MQQAVGPADMQHLMNMMHHQEALQQAPPQHPPAPQLPIQAGTQTLCQERVQVPTSEGGGHLWHQPRHSAQGTDPEAAKDFRHLAAWSRPQLRHNVPSRGGRVPSSGCLPKVGGALTVECIMYSFMSSSSLVLLKWLATFVRRAVSDLATCVRSHPD